MTLAAWTRRRTIILASGAVLMLVAACGGGGGSGTPATSADPAAGGGTDLSSLSGDIQIDGSSTVGPIAEAMAEEFGNASNVRVSVGISGTGGGFEKFCRGETDVTNASRPIRTNEAQACADRGIEPTEFRVAIDGLTVVVNPANTWASCLTFSQLRSIFDEGSSLSNWNQVDPSFPDEPLQVFSPGVDSGTFDYFSEEVNGTLDQFRGDGVTFSEDDNVLVLGVEKTRGAIGYFGYAYYQGAGDKLRALELDRDIDKAGLPLVASERLGCTAPTEDTVIANTYPLSRPLYMYVSNDSLKKPQVRGYLEFVLTNPQLISDVGYVQLEDALYQQALSKLRATK